MGFRKRDDLMKSKISEHAHQATLVSWFDRVYPKYKGRFFAIPNGEFRHKSTAIKLKIEGVRKGVPDLFLPVPNGKYNGLFIELKSEQGRASKEQIEWITFLESQGYSANICHGWDFAASVIKNYMEII